MAFKLTGAPMEQDKHTKRYYTMWRGQRNGPFDLTTLQDKLRRNEISLLHKVLVQGNWVTIRSFLESRKASVPETQPAIPAEPEWQDKAREEELEIEVERLRSELRIQDERSRATIVPPPSQIHQQPPPSVQPSQDQSSLVMAGWITLGVSFLLPPLAIVPFILGIILMAKSEVGHGIAVFLLSFVVPFMGGLFWVAFLDSM